MFEATLLLCVAPFAVSAGAIAIAENFFNRAEK